MSDTTNNRRPSFRYLSGEGKRNRANADLFQALLCTAWGEGCMVITGHHVSFMFDGDLSTEDEVPSADSVLFDHEIMGAVFGESHAVEIMREIAPLPRYRREDFVRELLCRKNPALNLSREPVPAPEAHA